MNSTPAKYPAVIAFAALVMAVLDPVSAAEPTGVTKLSQYRGWRDCYRLSNAELSIVIAPQVGGRLVELVYKGENFLWGDSGLDGADISCGTIQTYGAMPDLYRREWTEWDGCQPDASDEKYNQHSPLWCSPYTVKSAADYTLTLESAPATDSRAQAQIIKIFALDPARPVLKFGYALKNLDNKPRQWSLYYRCRLKPGIMLLPAAAERNFTLYPENKGLEAATRSRCLKREGDEFFGLIPQNLMLARAAEVVFGPVAEGLIALARRGAALIVRWQAEPDARYRDDTGLSVYWEGRFADIAPRSPVMEVAPGETVSFDTVWICAPYAGHGSDLAEMPAIKAAVEAAAKE